LKKGNFLDVKNVQEEAQCPVKKVYMGSYGS